mgnify:CR=1 FL=1
MGSGRIYEKDRKEVNKMEIMRCAMCGRKMTKEEKESLNHGVYFFCKSSGENNIYICSKHEPDLIGFIKEYRRRIEQQKKLLKERRKTRPQSC